LKVDEFKKKAINLKMGISTSLYTIEITVNGYFKKCLLVTGNQMKNDTGEIVVNYLSSLESYKSKENFINSLYDQLGEMILVDGIILPQNDISYQMKEKYMIRYIHTIILQSVERKENIDLDDLTSVNVFPIEDMTSIKL